MRKSFIHYHHWYLLIFLILNLSCKKDRTDSEAGTGTELVSFIIKKEKHPELWNDIHAEVQGDSIFAHTIVGTDVSELIPEFEHKGSRVTVNEVEQQSGNSKQDFTQLVEYKVESVDGESRTYIVKFSDTGLPAIHLFTDGKPILSKDEYVDGSIKITRGLQQDVLFEGITEIKGRGNSTWDMPKKPYRIKLDEKAELLGMPSDKSWALMANYGDQSLLRNDVAFEVSRRLGLEYTPRQQYVELFLNGEYMGNYTLTEHIKEGENRVPIDEDNGGFIIEQDGYANQELFHFYTPAGVPITVKFPDEDDITADEFKYIRNYISTLENSLLNSNADGQADYQQYFDLQSFVKYYLINEICGNTDMLWSMRMYKKSNQDPKIYVGPVWDFDLGFNNDKRLENSQQKLMLTNAHEPRAWMNQLMGDPEFKKLVRSEWNTVKGNLQSLPEYVDQQATLIRHSQIPNFLLWDVIGININQSWYTGKTHQDYVDFIRNYLTSRIAWLDTVINGQQFD